MIAGDTIGPYRVLDKLGEGGMGEVYRARDARLGREIALKILPASVATDPQRLARFAREARVLASLNHPNIAAIHGFEDPTASTPPALVLELVPGSTLAELLLRGPMPVDQSLAFARQIADALDAAHERGVVHRDLKPANIKITPDGTVKVLDFGIAKVLEDERASAAANTQTADATHIGTVIGSASYMSPEQARGEAVDRRTDIWAFGCVLFEMLAGARVFPGTTRSDAVATVLTSEPDWAALPAATPPAVLRLLGRCLQKDMRRRLRDIGDARADLDDANTAVAPAHVARGPARWTSLMAWGLVVVLAAALLWALYGSRREVGVPPLLRTSIILPDGATLATDDTEYPLALSPDGSTVAFVVQRDGLSELFARRLSESTAVKLAAATGSIRPFFSPDGRWIAYASNNTLQKVETAGGGTSIRICNVQGPLMGGTWGPDDTIVWATRGGGLSSVPAGGGTVRDLPDTHGFQWPHITPDGQWILFTTEQATAIARMPLAGGPRTILARLSREGRSQDAAVLGVGGDIVQTFFVSRGYLVYGQSPGILMALPVDPQSMVPTGPPTPLADPVERGRNSGGVYFAVSRAGLLVYAPTGRQHRLTWVTRQGVESPLGAEAGDFRFPVLSRDNSLLVVGMNDELRRPHVWLYETERGTRTWLGMRGLVFAWARDGKSIAAGDGAIVSIPTTPGLPRSTIAEAASLQKLLPQGTNPYPTSWSTDGRYILFHADTLQIWLLDTVTKEVRVLIADPSSRAGQATFSPDGQWIAYTSTSSGRDEVWVRSFPSLATSAQVSLKSGTNPQWSPAGDEIFYRQGDSVMSASIETSPKLRLSTPVQLFSGHYEGAGHDRTFTVTKDAKRFVMVKGDPASRLDRLTVVQNLFDHVKR
jgi:serine/threonine-protein kinase